MKFKLSKWVAIYALVGAPADIIAVKGDPSHNLKILENHRE
jgi:hypothetical protein